MEYRYLLKLRYGTSKGHETYGYITCSLRDMVANKRVGYCNGGGYCMSSSVLAQFINSEFKKEIMRLDETKYYGLHHRGERSYIDQGCGMNPMDRILEGLGYKRQVIEYSNSGDNQIWEIKVVE